MSESGVNNNRSQIDKVNHGINLVRICSPYQGCGKTRFFFLGRVTAPVQKKINCIFELARFGAFRMILTVDMYFKLSRAALNVG